MRRREKTSTEKTPRPMESVNWVCSHGLSGKEDTVTLSQGRGQGTSVATSCSPLPTS